jgi:uncharacterized protein YcfJ
MNATFKHVAVSVFAVGLLAGGSASAHQSDWSNGRWSHYDRDNDDRNVADYDYARVVDVDPIVRRVEVVTPQRECWNETRQVYASPRSATPAVLGAIVGGVIGHQFGSGSSRNAATVAGALLGASVGRDSASRDADFETRNVERCAITQRHDWQQQVDGYRVTYRYHGREYNTVMNYDPGNRVRVRVGLDVDVVH